MPYEQSQIWCATCQRYTLAQRPAPSHLVHGLVSLFLCGLWIPVWLIATLRAGHHHFRCSSCGALWVPQPASVVPTSAQSNPAPKRRTLHPAWLIAGAVASVPLAIVMIGFVAVVLGYEPKKEATAASAGIAPTAPSGPELSPLEETVNKVPIRIGSGGEDSSRVYFWQKDMSHAVTVKVGTKIRRLQDRGSRPKNAPPHAVRVWLESGDYAGEIGYIEPHYIEADR